MYAYRKPPRIRKMTWALTGVWVRGLTWLTARGSAPSIDIATATRVQPTMTLKTTWSALSRIPMIIKNRMIGLSVRTIARLLNQGAIGAPDPAGAGTGDDRGRAIVTTDERRRRSDEEHHDHDKIAEKETVPHDPLDLDEPSEALDEEERGERRGDHRGHHGARRGREPDAPIDEHRVAGRESEPGEEWRKAQDRNQPPAECLPLKEERNDHRRDDGEAKPRA